MRVAKSFIEDGTPHEVTVFAPESEPVSLTPEVGEAALSIRVPDIQMWSVVATN